MSTEMMSMIPVYFMDAQMSGSLAAETRKTEGVRLIVGGGH